MKVPFNININPLFGIIGSELFKITKSSILILVIYNKANPSLVFGQFITV